MAVENKADKDAVWQFKINVGRDGYVALAKDTVPFLETPHNIAKVSTTYPLIVRARMRAISADAPNRFIVAGLGIGGVQPNRGIFFKVDTVQAAPSNWHAYTGASFGPFEETTDTGISAEIGGGRKLLDIILDPNDAGTALGQVRFLIDGVLKATHTNPVTFPPEPLNLVVGNYDATGVLISEAGSIQMFTIARSP